MARDSITLNKNEINFCQFISNIFDKKIVSIKDIPSNIQAIRKELIHVQSEVQEFAVGNSFSPEVEALINGLSKMK